MENPWTKWMRTGGTLISGNLHFAVGHIWPYMANMIYEVYNGMWWSMFQLDGKILLASRKKTRESCDICKKLAPRRGACGICFQSCFGLICQRQHKIYEIVSSDGGNLLTRKALLDFKNDFSKFQDFETWHGWHVMDVRDMTVWSSIHQRSNIS